MTLDVPARRTKAEEYTGPRKELFYDDEWYSRDLESIFYKKWLVAGHVDELDTHGKYGFVTFRVGAADVMIRRAKDGNLRAFHNVCPHRGARLCDGPSGDARSRHIVCPYHQWTFDGADGALINSRRMHDDFDSSAYGLRSAHVEAWNGLIFICFADEPAVSLAAQLSASDVGGFDLSTMKLAATSQHVIEANWKVIVDNNMECYHCAVSHPELSKVLDWTFLDDEDHFDSFSAERAAGLDVFTFPFPVPTLSVEGKRVSTVLMDRFDGKPSDESRAIHWEPGVALGAFEDHAWLFVPRPLGPTQTELRQYWFVHRDAEEGRDYDVETVKEFWNTTMLQDKDLCEAVQQGVMNRAYEAGPLNRNYQGYNAGFYRWYEEQILRDYPELAGEVIPTH